jgi:cell division protease FtsH
MSTKLKKRNPWSTKKKWIVAFCVIALIVASVIGVRARVAYERAQLVTPLARTFEQNPQAWLSHPSEWSEFMTRLKAGQVTEIGFDGRRALYNMKSGEKHSAMFSCMGVAECKGTTDMVQLSIKNGVKLVGVSIDTATTTEVVLSWMGALLNIGFTLLMFGAMGFIIWMTASQASTDKLKLAERPEGSFDDVIGAEEAKKVLQRVKAFMKDPKKYAELGAKLPRGVLLAGPPGTGKTLLARALAAECGANFIAVDGAHFSSMYYGQGITKVKRLFAYARKQAPCVLFIDEADGMGKRQKGELSQAEQEGNRIINRILVEMDGFESDESVIVIAATNHVDNVDEALRRSGRFDIHAHLNNPTAPERAKLFDLYLKKVKAEPGIDTAVLARMASGFSPADISNMVNQAASRAADEGLATISEKHVFEAIETKQLGGDVNSVKDILSEQTRRRIAVHEAGHAVVAHYLGAGSVDQVSIEPRGGSLGVTFVNRENDEPLYGEEELRGRLAMMLAGREAELLVLGNTSSGASDDLKRATEMATSMAGSLGFGKTFGLLSVAGVPKELLGPDVQRAVLDEARGFLEAAQATVVELLDRERACLDDLTDLLLQHETVRGAPLKAVLRPHNAGLELLAA